MASDQVVDRKTPSEIIPNYEKKVAEYAAFVRSGVDGLLSAADAATELAKHMLAHYEKFRHDGAPDFMANSQNAREFASAVWHETERQYQEANPDKTEEEVQLLVNRFRRVYKNRIGDIRAQMCLELDRKPAQFRKRFPQAAERYPDLSPSEAMSFFYRADLLGPSERDRRSKRIKNLTARAERLPDGAERVALLDEIQDIHESLGKPRVPSQAVDLVRTTRRAVRQIGDATTQLSPADAQNLPDAEKRVLAQSLPTSINRLSALLAAVVDDD